MQAAQSYLESNRPRDALLAATEASKMAPERPEAHLVEGRAYALGDHAPEACASYEAARKKGSRTPALFAELASTYDVLKQYDDAAAVYRDYLSDHGQDAVMRDELALTLLLQNKPDAAASELRTALQTMPDSLQLQQDLGYALMRGKHFSEARDSLAPVVQKDPTRLDALRFLAQAYAGMGELPHARRLLSQVLTHDPNDRSARGARARLAVADGAAREALDDYQALLASTPQDGATLLGAAGALINLQRLDEAQHDVEQARVALGEHPQVRFRQAQIDWRRGKRAAIHLLEDLSGNPLLAHEAWDELYLAGKHFGMKMLVKKAALHGAMPGP